MFEGRINKLSDSKDGPDVELPGCGALRGAETRPDSKSV